MQDYKEHKKYTNTLIFTELTDVCMTYITAQSINNILKITLNNTL